MDRNIEAMFFSLPAEKRMELVSKLMDSPSFTGGMKGKEGSEDEANAGLAPSTPNGTMRPSESEANTNSQLSELPSQESVSDMNNASDAPSSVGAETRVDEWNVSQGESVNPQMNAVVTTINPIVHLAESLRQHNELFVLLLGIQPNDVTTAGHVNDVLKLQLGKVVNGMYIQKGILKQEHVDALGFSQYGSPLQLVQLKDKAVEESSDENVPINIHRINLIINVDYGLYTSPTIRTSQLIVLHSFKDVQHIWLSHNSLDHSVMNTQGLLQVHLANMDYKNDLQSTAKTVQTFGDFSTAFNALLSEIASVMQVEGEDVKALDKYKKALKTFTAAMATVDPRRVIQESETYKRFYSFVYNFYDIMKMSMFVDENLAKVVQGEYDDPTNDIVRNAVAYQVRSEMFKDMKEDVIASFEAMKEQEPAFEGDTPIIDMISLEEVYKNYEKYKKIKFQDAEIGGYIQEFFRLYDIMQDSRYIDLPDDAKPYVWLPSISKEDDTLLHESLESIRTSVKTIGDVGVRSFLKDSIFGLGTNVLDSINVLEGVVDILSGVENRNRRRCREALLSFVLANYNNKYFAKAVKSIEAKVRKANDDKAASAKAIDLTEVERDVLKQVKFTSVDEIDSVYDKKGTLGKDQGYDKAFDSFIDTISYLSFALLDKPSFNEVDNGKQFAKAYAIPSIASKDLMKPAVLETLFSEVGMPYAYAAPVKKWFKRTAKPQGETTIMNFYKFMHMVSDTTPIDDQTKQNMALGIHYYLADHFFSLANQSYEQFTAQLAALNIQTSSVQKYKNSDASIAQAYVDTFNNYYNDGVSKAQQDVLEKVKEAFKAAASEIQETMQSKPMRGDPALKQQTALLHIYKLVLELKSNLGEDTYQDLTKTTVDLFGRVMNAYGDTSDDTINNDIRGLLARLLLRFKELDTPESPGVQKVVSVIRKNDSLAQFRWILEIEGDATAVEQQFKASSMSFESMNLLLDKIMESVSEENQAFTKLEKEDAETQSLFKEKVRELQLAIADSDVHAGVTAKGDEAKQGAVNKQLEKFVKAYVALDASRKKHIQYLDEKKNEFIVSEFILRIDAMKESLNAFVAEEFEAVKKVLDDKLEKAGLPKIDDRDVKNAASASSDPTSVATSIGITVASTIDDDDDTTSASSGAVTSLSDIVIDDTPQPKKPYIGTMPPQTPSPNFEDNNAVMIQESDDEDRLPTIAEEDEEDKPASGQQGGGLLSTVPKRLQSTIEMFLVSVSNMNVSGLDDELYTRYEQGLDAFLKGLLAKSDIEDIHKVQMLSLLAIVIQQLRVDPKVNILKDAFKEKVDIPALDSKHFAAPLSMALVQVPTMKDLSLQAIFDHNLMTTANHKLPIADYIIPHVAYFKAVAKGGRGKKGQVGGSSFYDGLQPEIVTVVFGGQQSFARAMLSTFMRYISNLSDDNKFLARNNNFHTHSRVILMNGLQQILKTKSGPLAKKLQKLLKGRITAQIQNIVDRYIDSYSFGSANTAKSFEACLYLLSGYYPSSEKAYAKFKEEMEAALKQLDITDSDSKKKLKDSDFDDVEKQRILYKRVVKSAAYTKGKPIVESTSTLMKFVAAMDETSPMKKDILEAMARFMERKELQSYLFMLRTVSPKSRFEEVVNELQLNRFEVQLGGGLLGNVFRNIKEKSKASSEKFKTKLRDMVEGLRDKMAPMRISESILLNDNYALKDHLTKIVEKSKKDKMVMNEKNVPRVDANLVPNLYESIVRQNAGAQELLGTDLPSVLTTLKDKKEIGNAIAKINAIQSQVRPPPPVALPQLPPPSTSTNEEPPTGYPGSETRASPETKQESTFDASPPSMDSVDAPASAASATSYNENVAASQQDERPSPRRPLSRANSAMDNYGTPTQEDVSPATKAQLEQKVKDFKGMPATNQPVMTVAYASQAPMPEYTKGSVAMPTPAMATIMPSAPLMPATVAVGTPVAMGAPAESIITRVVNAAVAARAEDSIGINLTRKTALEARVNEYLGNLADFVAYMQNKSQKWMEDVNGAIQRDMNGPEGINKKLGAKGDETAQKQAKNDIRRFYNKFLGMIGKKSDSYFAFVKNYYMKQAKGEIKAILRYLEVYAKLVDPSFKKTVNASASNVLTEESRKYEAIEKQFATITSQFDQINNNFYIALSGILDKYGGTALTELDDDTRVTMQAWIDDLSNQMNKNRLKIKSYYKLNYSMADVVLDAQFVTLYVIKAIRIGFAYLALFLAARVFTPMYETEVFDKKLDPPSLTKFLLIYLGFDLSFNVFILVVLFLLKFMFKSDDNAFMIDSYLFQKYMIDYGISMVLLFSIGAIVGSIFMNKKYFKYKYEGMRAIRAFQEVMFYIACVVFVFPYFMIL